MPASAELLPTPEMVGVAWLKANVPFLRGYVATSLPKENDEWADVGFVTVASVGGGRVAEGIRSSVLSLTYYGVKPASGKAPWNRTSQMCEQVREVVDPTGKSYGTTRALYRLTNLGPQYKDAKVLNAFWTSEPQRRPGDAADFAIYQHEIELHWIVVNA